MNHLKRLFHLAGSIDKESSFTLPHVTATHHEHTRHTPQHYTLHISHSNKTCSPNDTHSKDIPSNTTPDIRGTKGSTSCHDSQVGPVSLCHDPINCDSCSFFNRAFVVDEGECEKVAPCYPTTGRVINEDGEQTYSGQPEEGSVRYLGGRKLKNVHEEAWILAEETGSSSQDTDGTRWRDWNNNTVTTGVENRSPEVVLRVAPVADQRLRVTKDTDRERFSVDGSQARDITRTSGETMDMRKSTNKTSSVSRPDGWKYTALDVTHDNNRQDVHGGPGETSDGAYQQGDTTREAFPKRHDEVIPGTTPHSGEVASKHPDIDGGWAYVIALAVFFVSFIQDGPKNSFGILLPSLERDLTSNVALISLSAGVMSGTWMAISPLTARLVKRFGCRPVAFTGGLVTCVSLVLSTFSTSVQMFIVCYGLLAGVGIGLFNLPAITIVNQYFQRKRGLVLGVVTSGSGVGLLVMSLVIERLIDHYGWRGAYLLVGGFYLQVCLCAALMRPLSPSPFAAEIKQEGWKEEWKDEKKGTMEEEVTKTCAMYSFQHDRRQVTQTTSQGNGGNKCKTRMDTTNTNTTTTNNNNINKDEGRDEDRNENENEIQIVNNFVWNEPYPDHPLSPSTNTNEDTATTIPSPSRPSSIPTISSSQPDSSTSSQWPQPPSSTSPQWPQSPSPAPPPTPSPPSSPSPQQFSNYTSPQPSLITASASQQLSPPSSSSSSSPTPTTPTPPSSPTPPTTPPPSSSPTPPTTTPSSSPGPDKDSTLSLLKDPCFLIFCTTAFLIQLTNNIAPMFYPSYAQSMGLPSEQTAKIVSVFGISNTVGRFVTGLLSQLGVNNLLLYSAGTVLTGVLYFLIPLYTSYETLLASAAGQAFFIGVFPPLQSVILVELLGLERLPYSFGLMTFCKSVGSIAGPSLSGALYQLSSDYTLPFVFAGSVLSAANLLHIALAVLTRRKSKRLGTVPVS